MIKKNIPITFAPIEDTLSRMLFGWQQQFSRAEKKPDVKPSSNGTASSVSKPTTEEPDAAKRHAKKEDWRFDLRFRGRKGELLFY